MRSLFIAAALMMTSFITATAQESTVQITTNGPGGNAQYVIKGVPYMTAPANPIILQLGKQPGFIPVAVAELLPNQVLYTGADGRITQTTLANNEVIIGSASGIEKRELVAGSFITFDKTVAGKLKINGDPGGGFGGGLLKFNVVNVTAANFFNKGGGRCRLQVNGGSYFRVTQGPTGGATVDEIEDITAGNDYSEGSLILIEIGAAAGAMTIRDNGTLSVGPDPADFALLKPSSATLNMTEKDIIMFIRTANGWLEVSSVNY